MFPTSNGGTRVESLDESFLIPPAEEYTINGLDHIGSYIPRLFDTSNDFKSLSFFDTSGRGLGLHSRDGRIEAVFTLCKRTELRTERLIRSFFMSLGVQPSKDYLADNGGRPDATLVLAYPLNRNLSEAVAFVRRILIELCGVQPGGGLQIKYWTKRKQRKASGSHLNI
jgi:hypothetical protein